MNRKLRLVALLLVALAALACHRAPPPETQASPPAPEEQALPASVQLSGEARAEIEVVPARWAPVEEVLSATASLQADPDRKAVVAAPVGGVVVRYAARVGDWLHQGAPVAVLQSPEVARARGEYAVALKEVELARANLERERALAGLGALTRDAMESARRDLAEARSRVLEADSLVGVARSQVHRVEELAREEIVSQRELELARAELAQALARQQAARESLATHESHYHHEEKAYRNRYLAARVLQPLEGELARDEQALEAASRTLEALQAGPGEGGSLAVLAPIDGYVAARQATVGQSVEASTSLATMLDNRVLWAVVDFYEKDLPRLAEGATVRVTPAAGGPGVTGRLKFLSPEVETEARTIEGWVRLDSPPASYREGMFVTVQVRVPQGRQGVLVPAQALQDLEDQKVVFVGTASGGFERRTVKTGTETPEGVEVVGGLKPGEKIVSRGSFRVKSEFLRGTLGEED